jgi:hypothetical protein
MLIHRAQPNLTHCQDSRTEPLLSTTAYYSIVDSLIEGRGCGSLDWGPWRSPTRGHTMALSIGSFAIEIHLTALDIRAGSYDLS